MEQGLTNFSPIENLDSALDFTEIYGDSFISGISPELHAIQYR